MSIIRLGKRYTKPPYGVFFKEAWYDFNWSLHVQYSTLLTIIVIALAGVISPVFLLFLLAILYPIPYCVYRAYVISKERGWRKERS